MSDVQQENSLLVRSFLVGVNATGVHLVYGGSECAGLGRGQSKGANVGLGTPQLTLNTSFVSYTYSKLVTMAPDVDTLALTVRGPTQEIEQFVLKTSQVSYSPHFIRVLSSTEGSLF